LLARFSDFGFVPLLGQIGMLVILILGITFCSTFVSWKDQLKVMIIEKDIVGYRKILIEMSE
jgi:hypothetical protein